jgi:hypothetical protein
MHYFVFGFNITEWCPVVKKNRRKPGSHCTNRVQKAINIAQIRKRGQFS